MFVFGGFHSNSFRMSCMVFSMPIGLTSDRAYAVPASVAQSQLGITFGLQSEITTRREANMAYQI